MATLLPDFNMLHRIILFFFSLSMVLSTYAQTWELIEKNEPFFYRFRLVDSLDKSPLDFPPVQYSSWVLRSATLANVSKSCGDQEETLRVDPHQPELDQLEQSIQYFKQDEKEPVKLINSGGNSLELLLFYAPALNLLSKDTHVLVLGCMEPPAIPQSQWRTGLPEPTVLPTTTPTHHVIVHHSAGSNTNADPTALVRDIYLLHTQGNGWDDIGYNYLIARNGTLFLGRDPQGIGEQDYIRGAHYCSKNSYTQGICVLGEYTTAQPPDTMMQSLRKLIAWKMFKDRIEPQNQSLHPPGDPNAYLVYHLDGHRSGCATNCPGNKVYERLHALRDTLTEDLLKCGFTSIEGAIVADDLVIYPNPSKGKIYFSRYVDAPVIISGLQGQQLFHGVMDPLDHSIEAGLSPGLYFLRIAGTGLSEIIVVE